MTAPLDQQAMRARHTRQFQTAGGGADYCFQCSKYRGLVFWPCDAIQALDALGDARRECDDWEMASHNFLRDSVGRSPKKVLEELQGWAPAIADNESLRALNASLEADLAAMRGALELLREWRILTWCEYTVNRMAMGSPCAEYAEDEFERLVDAALASSPGAAWLATAREVVEALNQIVSVDRSAGACDDCMDGEGLCNQHADKWRAAMLVARALLARPEVKAWAGR